MAAKVSADDCISCAACVDACPQEAITMEDHAVVNEDDCIECGICVDECPVEAITL